VTLAQSLFFESMFTPTCWPRVSRTTLDQAPSENPMHRSRQLTVIGLGGVMYSVVVTAECLDEAIALGMAEIQNSPWTGKIAEPSR
jgi:hypothetical protein